MSDLPTPPSAKSGPLRAWVVREWRGRVPGELSEGYLALMQTVAIPDYRRIEGNQGAFCWHRRDGEAVEVTMVSWWRDLDCIRAFAGDDISIAKYYPFDADFLLEMDPHVTHYTCFGQPA